MKASNVLNRQGTQAELAELIGVSDARVSQLVKDCVIERGATLHAQLLAYCAWLREVAAGRAPSEIGDLSLVAERALLARSMREGHDIKNAVSRGSYAPVELLAEVLAIASQSVSERFDQLPAQLKRVCPDLPAPAREQIMQVIASARNEWAVQTVALVTERLSLDDPDPEYAEADREPL